MVAINSYRTPSYNFSDTLNRAQLVGQSAPGYSGPAAPALSESMQAIMGMYPEYSSVSLQDAQGNLLPQYMLSAPSALNVPGQLTAGQLNVGDLSANSQALDFMRERAMAQGDSPWARLQLDRQMKEQQDLQNLAGMRSRGATNQAMGDLAMRGGLSSGARERLARAGAQDLRKSYQDVSSAGMGNRSDIRIADEGQKMALLQQVPGLDLRFADQRAGLEKFNIDSQMRADAQNLQNQLAAEQFNRQMELDAARANQQAALGSGMRAQDWQMNKFNQLMQGYSADKMSQAIGAGGDGGGGSPMGNLFSGIPTFTPYGNLGPASIQGQVRQSPKERLQRSEIGRRTGLFG